MGLEAIVFDAEGVVIDTEAIWDEGQRKFLAGFGIEYDRERVKPMLTGRSLLDGTRTLVDLYELPGDPETLARQRAEMVRRLMTTVDYIPGFTEFFARIRDDYRTCVATAMAPELFEPVDRSLELRRLFDGHVYTLADVGQRSKPDPALFLFAASRIETPPARCVVIEDSPHGVTAARRAGMPVVGLATTYAPEALADANLVISAYEELDLADPRLLAERATG